MTVNTTATWFVLGLSTLALSACVTPMQSADQESDPGSQTVTAHSPELPNQSLSSPELPNQSLSSSLLSELFIAELSYYRGDAETSIELLEQIAFETKDPRIAETVSIRAISHQHYDAATNTSDLWVELSPESASAWYTKAVTRIATEKYDEAVTSFTNMLQYAENQSEAISQIARVVSSNVQPAQAFSIFSKVILSTPDSVDGKLHLIIMASQAGLDSELDDMFAEAFELDADSDDIAAIKFTYYLRRHRTDEAKTFAQQFLSRYPNSPKLRSGYADYLSQLGLYREAVTQLEQVSHSESLYKLGVLHVQANYLELATEKFEAYHEQVPNDQSVFLDLAEITLSQKRYEETREWITKITARQLAFDKLLLIARYTARTANVEDAISMLQEYETESDQEKISIYLTIDNMYRNSEQLEKAKLTLDDALEQYPKNRSLLLARSYTASELNMISLVESDIHALLAQDPDHVLALNALGYILADQTDRYDEALEFIEQALESRPYDPYILDSMGWVQYKLGNFADAIKFLKLAIEGRDDPVMAAHLGEVYWMQGKPRLARITWDNALKKTPDSKILIETIKKFTN